MASLSKLSDRQIKLTPSIVSQLPQGRKRKFLDGWLAKTTKAFVKDSKSISREETKINDWLDTSELVARQLLIQEAVVIGIVTQIKIELDRGTLVLDRDTTRMVGRRLGLTGRDLPARQMPFQTVASVELCRESPHQSWKTHSTEEHWWPAQWCGETLFLDELYGRHAPDEILTKLNTYREVIIATKFENSNTLSEIQKTHNYPGCPFKAYEQADIALTARLPKLPGGRKKAD